MKPAVFEFRLDGFHFRTMDQWREEISRVEIPGRTVAARRIGNRVERAWYSPPTAIVERSSPTATAKRHALAHGHAGIWHADDSLTVFTRDGEKVRQRTYRRTRLLQP